jgi:multiple sugar transport system ATP-binding protein
MATVVLEKLVKIYPDKNGPGVRAVNSIDLEIKDREFMVLVGPSGCGKSTTLRMVAGLEEISAGTISIDGRVVNNVLPKDRDIAMVFQNYALYPHMSVYDNMAFGLKLRKLPKLEIDQRVREAAAMLGLQDYLERRPKALSGGQRQRVAVGRAIVRKPKVFLFDEPLSNLDAKMRVSMRTEIAKLHHRLDATMIYVTHDQVEAMTMGDRICVMKDGNIMQVDQPIALYSRPANLFTAGFIGSPQMNLIKGTIVRDGASLCFRETNTAGVPLLVALGPRLESLVSPHQKKPIVLGIRPEDLHEAGAEDPGEDPVVQIEVEVAEPMGAETYLHLNTGAHMLIARVKPSSSTLPGQKVRLRFDSLKIEWFDPATEAAIR